MHGAITSLIRVTVKFPWAVDVAENGVIEIPSSTSGVTKWCRIFAYIKLQLWLNVLVYIASALMLFYEFLTRYINIAAHELPTLESNNLNKLVSFN